MSFCSPLFYSILAAGVAAPSYVALEGVNLLNAPEDVLEEVAEKKVKIYSRLGTPVRDVSLFPRTAGLLLDGNHHCGALMVSDRVLVTAAHCLRTVPDSVKPIRAARFKAFRGIHPNHPSSSSSSVVGMKSHPNFKYFPRTGTAVHDIALVFLNDALLIDGKIQVATGEIPVGTAVRVAGWGIDETDKVPSSLMAVTMRTTNNCGTLSIHPGQVCIVDYLNVGAGQSVCRGDSGSPAYANSQQIVGIVSSTVKGCQKTKSTHDSLTLIGKYMEFIGDVWIK